MNLHGYKGSSIYDFNTDGGRGAVTKKGLKMWTDVDVKRGGAWWVKLNVWMSARKNIIKKKDI